MIEPKEHGRGERERGSIMVVALMMLALLTLIGLMATRNSGLELKMVENDGCVSPGALQTPIRGSRSA